KGLLGLLVKAKILSVSSRIFAENVGASLPSQTGPCFDRGMGHGPPIRIETLADLAAHDYGLNAMCGRCWHRADLDMPALIERLGGSFVYVGKTLDRRLHRTQCGKKNVNVQVHIVHNPWKPKP